MSVTIFFTSIPDRSKNIAAYAAMFLERSGLKVKKIVTLIATEEGTVQVFQKYNLDDYLQLLKSYIEEFVRGRHA